LKESVLLLLADDVIHEMTAAQVLQKQLFDAHEPNLLDENGKIPLLNGKVLVSFSSLSSNKGYLYQVTQVDFFVLPASISYVYFFVSLIFRYPHMHLYCLLLPPF
jgi:hypothetical protein